MSKEYNCYLQKTNIRNGSDQSILYMNLFYSYGKSEDAKDSNSHEDNLTRALAVTLKLFKESAEQSFEEFLKQLLRGQKNSSAFLILVAENNEKR